MSRALLAAAVRWGDTWIDAITTHDRPIALGTSLSGAADRVLATPGPEHATLHVPGDAVATRNGEAIGEGDHRLAVGDRARVEWGGLVFELAWSAELEPLARSGHDEAEFARILGMTVVIHGVLVAAALGAPNETDLGSDMLRRNGHMISVLFEKPKPKPVPKLALAKSAPGQSHASSSGGARPSPIKTPPRGDPRKSGLLAILGEHSTAESTVFSHSSMTGLNIAMAGLQGPAHAGSGDGIDGLGSRGPGGPGGNSLDIGVFGHPGGHGPGGPGGPGPSLARREMLPGPSRQISVENISKEEIGRVIRNNLPRFKYCYEKSLSLAPDSSGKVAVGFTIAPTGSVASAVIRETSLNSSEVEDCVVRVMMTLKFPQPRGGGVAVVTYPFVFAAAGN